MVGYPYQGFYDPFGFQRRNRLVDLPFKNPDDAPNAMSADTGNAGLDGYSVLSRASRHSGERPDIGGTPEFEGPKLDDC